jgi:iron-sulfur cluster insertion protein
METFDLNITITDSAVEKIKEILSEELDKTKSLRIFVQGGGCSGMEYGFTFDDKQEDDFVIAAGGIEVLVDSASVQYLTGSTVKYVEDFMGSKFTIDNPHATTTCGCGSSFSVDNYDYSFMGEP